MLLAGVPALVNSYRAARTAAEATRYARAIGGIIGFEASTWTATGLAYIYYKHHHVSKKMPQKRLGYSSTMSAARQRLSNDLESVARGNRSAKRTMGANYRPMALSHSTYYNASNRNRRTGGVIGRFQPSPGNELKWLDTSYNVATSNPGTVIGLVPTIVVRGTGPTERIGIGIIIKSLQFKGLALNDPLGASIGSGTFYYFLVLDKESNGVAPGILDIFTDSNLTVANVNLANSARFTIIKKWVHNFNPGAGVSTAYSHRNKVIDYYAKANIPIKWAASNSSGTAAGVTQNQLYIVQSGTSTECRMEGTFRIRFADMH